MEIPIRPPKSSLSEIPQTKQWLSAKAIADKRRELAALPDSVTLSQQQDEEYAKLWSFLHTELPPELYPIILKHLSSAELSDILVVAQALANTPSRMSTPTRPSTIGMIEQRFTALYGMLKSISTHENPLLTYCYFNVRYDSLNVRQSRLLLKKLHDEPLDKVTSYLAHAHNFNRHYPMALEYIPSRQKLISAEEQSVHKNMSQAWLDAWFRLPRAARKEHEYSIRRVASKRNVQREFIAGTKAHNRIYRTEELPMDIENVSQRHDLEPDEYRALIVHDQASEESLMHVISSMSHPTSRDRVSDAAFLRLCGMISQHSLFMANGRGDELARHFSLYVRDRKLRAQIMQRSDLPATKYDAFMAEPLDRQEQYWIFEQNDFKGYERGIMAARYPDLSQPLFNVLTQHENFDSRAIASATQRPLDDRLFDLILNHKDFSSVAACNLAQSCVEYERRLAVLNKLEDDDNVVCAFLGTATDARELKHLLTLNFFNAHYMKSVYDESHHHGLRKAARQLAGLEMIAEVGGRGRATSKDEDKALKNTKKQAERKKRDWERDMTLFHLGNELKSSSYIDEARKLLRNYRTTLEGS